jgi:folate-binding protein YgfZ
VSAPEGGPGPAVRVELGPTAAARLEGAVAGLREVALTRVEGSGALACLQGIFCNDLDAPGEGSLVYGAFLSPKGMIVADAWILREPEGFVVVLPPSARAPVADLFRRTLPPRLARARDVSEAWRVAWVGGRGGRDALDRWLGAEAPAPGRATRRDDGVLVGAATAPFAGLLSGPAAGVEAALLSLGRAGVVPAGAGDLEGLRILAGWPAMAAEIDDRTLPQEVRFDEHGGLSYAKGCYVGQETVARLHFRGHANRVLRGLDWGGGVPAGNELVQDGKVVGRLRSLLVLPGRTLGLAPVRREVPAGSQLLGGGVPARVTELPFPAA